MTTDLLADLEKCLPAPRAALIEDVDEQTNTVRVRAVPFGHEIELVPDVFEAFEHGAFSRVIKDPGRVKLRLEHGGPLVGVATVIEELDDGLWINYRFGNDEESQRARSLAMDRIYDQVSITFGPRPDGYRITRDADRVHIVHHRVNHLYDTSLVAHGAYGAEAFIAYVRSLETAGQDAAALAEAREAERTRRLLSLMTLTH